MSKLTIGDLPVTPEQKGEEGGAIRSLSREELHEIWGGRSVAVTVDGTSTGTVDDFSINMAIFEGRIKGSYIL